MYYVVKQYRDWCPTIIERFTKVENARAYLNALRDENTECHVTFSIVQELSE